MKCVLLSVRLLKCLIRALHPPLVACDTGRWGLDCVSVCDCGNSDGECDAQTGRCRCEAGFTGPRCAQSE